MEQQTLPLATDQSPSIAALAAALAKAQGEMTGAKKDSNNPGFKSKYADLASVWEACRVALSKNNLSVVQRASIRPEGVAVRTRLMHSSGEWMEDELVMPLTARTAHAVGTAITYARRYALAAMVGIAQEDDDGNEASKETPKEEGRREAPRQQAAKQSKTEEAKAALGAVSQAELWFKVVGIGAMFGKSEEQMKTFARTVLGGSRQLKTADVATIHDALAMTGKPIVGQDAAGVTQ